MYLLEIQSSTCQSFKSLQYEKSKSEKTVYKNVYACDVTSCVINLSLFPFAAVASRAIFGQATSTCKDCLRLLDLSKAALNFSTHGLLKNIP